MDIFQAKPKEIYWLKDVCVWNGDVFCTEILSMVGIVSITAETVGRY